MTITNTTLPATNLRESVISIVHHLPCIGKHCRQQALGRIRMEAITRPVVFTAVWAGAYYF